MWQGCRTPGRQAARTTKFCIEAPNIYGSAVCKMLLVALLAPRILRWLAQFFKMLFIPDVWISKFCFELSKLSL